MTVFDTDVDEEQEQIRRHLRALQGNHPSVEKVAEVVAYRRRQQMTGTVSRGQVIDAMTSRAMRLSRLAA
jgi:hypothetical protein